MDGKDTNSSQNNGSKINDEIFKPTAATVSETRNNGQSETTRRIDTFTKNED